MERANVVVSEQDIVFSQNSRKRWDNQSDWYSRQQRYELPSIVSCIELTDLSSKTGPVIEVGCGTGLHSETIAKAFLGCSGSVLVACDFSKAMVNLMQDRFAQSSFTREAGHKVVMNCQTDFADPTNSDVVDLERILQENAPFDKLVYGCLADNMRLPFADATFEAYVSNLSL